MALLVTRQSGTLSLEEKIKTASLSRAHMGDSNISLIFSELSLFTPYQLKRNKILSFTGQYNIIE